MKSLRWKHHMACAVVGAGVIAGSAVAAAASGGEQDFVDGNTMGVTGFEQASTGEPAPFDAFRGRDRDVAFDAAFTLEIEPASYTAGALTLGIYDHDSAASGEQVGHFGVDGVDLTAELNALLEGSGGGQSEYNVYTVTLPGPALAALGDGSGTFRLTLAGPGLAGDVGTLDERPGNGAGLDFVELDLEAEVDADGDGLNGDVDTCAATAEGDAVDGAGCSIDQLVPCDGDWRNHGQYVNTFARTAEQFEDEELITEEEKGALVAEAAASGCGRAARR